MSNMENFSADELLRRLKENLGTQEDAQDTSENDKKVEDSKEAEVLSDEVLDDSSESGDEITVEATLDEDEDMVIFESEKNEKSDETALVSDETISFDVAKVLQQSESEEAECEISADDSDDFDAPTIEIPNISELELPDAEAFEAASEDSAAEKIALQGASPILGDEKAEALDATDLSLIVALGDKEGLDKARKELGEDKFLEYTTAFSVTEESGEEEADIEDDFDIKAHFSAFNDEYESHEQTPEVYEKYKSEAARIKLRLIGSAILAFCLLIFENLHIWGVTLPGGFNAIEYPAVHSFVCLQILVLAAALSYKELISGFIGITSFEFSPHTVVGICVAFTALCDLLIGFFGGGEEPGLYNFAATFILVLCALHDYLNIKREMYSFDIVSSKKSKYAVISESNLKVAEYEFGFEKFSEEPDVTLNVKKVGFVKNYFSRTNSKTASDKYTPYFVFGALAVAVILSIISAVNTKSATTAFEVANLTALMCLPVSLLSASSLPFFLASKCAYENESAIIGDKSVDEYSGASTVVFDDKDVFPARSVKVKSVKVFGETRIDTVLYDLTGVYSKLGGPLYEVLSRATAEIGASENVEITECADSGVSAKVDSERSILIGDSVYMEQNGIFPVYDYEDEIQLAGGNIRIMYVAYDGELASKMYVQYAISPDFDGMLRRLYRNGMNVVIKTMDPNIDNTLLVGKAKPVNYPAKIEKCSIEAAGTQEVESADSGIVSRANTKSLVSAILLCDKLQHVRFTSNIVKIMSVIVSLVIMMIFIIANSSSLILSVFVAIYHLFWMLPVFVISRMYLK